MINAETRTNPLWQLRLYYFLLTGATGFLFPFLTLFLERQGLSGTQIGFVGTISSLITLIAAPLWGRLSDSLVNPKRLLQFAFVSTAAINLLISQQKFFFWFALLIGLDGLINAGTSPISDTLALGASQEPSNKGGFGSIRLWGSLGWAVVVFFSGWLIEQTSLTAAFIGYALLMVATALVINNLRTPPVSPKNVSNSRDLFSTDVLKLLYKDRALAGLALALVLYWFTRGGIYKFEPIYMDRLGAGEAIIGLSSTIGALVEIPMMLLADRLLHRIGSHQLLLIALLLNALGFSLVFAAPSVGMIVGMRAFGGIAFAFYSVALAMFIGERAPLGKIATTMALFTITLRGVIGMVGSPVSGVVFDVLGPGWLYMLGAAGCILSLLVLKASVTGTRSGEVDVK